MKENFELNLQWFKKNIPRIFKICKWNLVRLLTIDSKLQERHNETNSVTLSQTDRHNYLNSAKDIVPNNEWMFEHLKTWRKITRNNKKWLTDLSKAFESCP